MTLVVPRYSAPVAVADVLVVLGMATTNNAAVGKGIGKVAVRDEEYPHCTLKNLSPSSIADMNGCKLRPLVIY